jgi:hypothetical protein
MNHDTLIGVSGDALFQISSQNADHEIQLEKHFELNLNDFESERSSFHCLRDEKEAMVVLHPYKFECIACCQAVQPLLA